MTRTQLADTAKISRATLAKNEPVSMEVLLRICDDVISYLPGED